MANIAAHRLHNQQIETPEKNTPTEVVAWLVAMQGQDYPGAKWSVGLRLPSSTDTDIEQAIAAHAIIRTWLIRGTLHLVAAADLRWVLALIASRLITGNARRYGQLELDEATLMRSNDLLADTLQGGKQLSRPELFDILESHGISTAGQRGVYLLQRASLDGLICQSVVRGNYATFVHIDDVIPPVPAIPRDQALAEFARRYFVSHGPANLKDYIAWSGLTTAEARAGLEAVKAQLVEDSYAGETYWRPASTPAAPAAPVVHMLPGFDEYVLGYRDRSAVLDPQHAQKICPGGNGVFYPTIVVDGQIVGTWKRTLKKNKAIINAQPFNGLSAEAWQAFAAAAQKYGDYLDMSVEIVPL
ncbi:MAG: winged helix DNA-binding domain-containing protein [Anaerolineae bacterium]|nr:winged helix DNA-binding domain-containing protein [Anaerolineae bacterium]